MIYSNPRSNVQPQLVYSSRLQFVCFDICIDGVICPYTTVEKYCPKVDILHAAILKRGTFSELENALDIVESFESLYPAAHGLTPAKPVIAEGIILRTRHLTHAIGTIDETRPILKLKRKAFTERKPAKHVEKDKDTIKAALRFVTTGRLASVKSKVLSDAPF